LKYNLKLKKMIFSSKEEWFKFDSPIGEPDYEWKRIEGDRQYHIKRMVKEDGTTIWFGIKINWMKERDVVWTVLTKNENAVPIRWSEDPIPEPIYSAKDRWIFVPCEMPIYEKLYQENYIK